MLEDAAHGKILNCYRDENLDKGALSHMADDLRRIPAEQRQNAIAELFKRTTRSIVREHAGVFLTEIVSTGITFNEAMSQILDENGW